MKIYLIFTIKYSAKYICLCIDIQFMDCTVCEVALDGVSTNQERLQSTFEHRIINAQPTLVVMFLCAFYCLIEIKNHNN